MPSISDAKPLRNPACEMLTAAIASVVQTSKHLFLPSKLHLSLLPCLNRAAVQVLFSPATLSSLVWHPFFPSYPRPVTITTPAAYFIWGYIWDGEPGNECCSRKRGDKEVRLVIGMGEAVHERLQSSKSSHSALKSADTAFSPHPENDLICSWWLVITAVNSYLWF